MGSVRRSTWRQFVPYLFLNVAVSVFTAFLVFQILGRPSSPGSADATPTLDVVARVASALPTPTDTVLPSPTPETYKVQRGDTLYSVASELGVPLDDLMEANGIRDPNTLDVGQVLIVPFVEGRAPRATDTPVAAAQPQPSATLSSAQLPNVEILGVSGAGNLSTEMVRLLNTGGVAYMAGWTLDDGDQNVFIFPAFSLHNGAVSVHSREGTNTVIDLFWGLSEAVWTPGKTITLRDTSGTVLSSFQIPGN